MKRKGLFMILLVFLFLFLFFLQKPVLGRCAWVSTYAECLENNVSPRCNGECNPNAWNSSSCYCILNTPTPIPTSTPVPTATTAPPQPTATPPPCNSLTTCCSSDGACSLSCPSCTKGFFNSCNSTYCPNYPNYAKVYDTCKVSQLLSYNCSNRGYYCGYSASCVLPTPTPGGRSCDPDKTYCSVQTVSPIDCNYDVFGCNVCGVGRTGKILCDLDNNSSTPYTHCGDVCVSDSSCNTNQWCTVPTPTSGGPTSTPGGPTNTPTPTLTPSPTPTPGPWTKLKNTSFISPNSLISLIPLIPVAYDADDDASANFIIGDAGLVAAPSVNITTLNPSAKTGNPEYKAAYSPTYLLTPNSYLSYIKTRKQHTVITSLSEITGSGIYVYNGALSINSNSYPFNQPYNIVLISTGTITVTVPDVIFAPAGSVAIVAPTINFNAVITEANGIFIADNINTGSTTNKGLKIIGNLIAQTSFINGREWINVNKPVLFIVFDSQKYLDLLPYLSTANYEWRQVQ